MSKKTLVTYNNSLDALLENQPRRVDRKLGADLVSFFFFPISSRTLESWPLNVTLVNGHATVETAELFAAAQAKLDAAPTVRGGRRPKPPFTNEGGRDDGE